MNLVVLKKKARRKLPLVCTEHLIDAQQFKNSYNIMCETFL